MPLTPDLVELAAKVRNWDRWGPKDERGTANLIDGEATRRGAGTVRAGRSIGLTIPLGLASPQEGGAPRRFNPIRTMLTINEPYSGDIDDACFNDDMVTMPLSAATHLDALAHVTYGGQMYNGYPAERVTAGRARSSAAPTRSGRSSPAASCSTCRRPRASSGSSPATPSRPTTSTRPSSTPEGDARAGRRRARAHRPDAALHAG
jgi:hypothetical protein